MYLCCMQKLLLASYLVHKSNIYVHRYNCNFTTLVAYINIPEIARIKNNTQCEIAMVIGEIADDCLLADDCRIGITYCTIFFFMGT